MYIHVHKLLVWVPSQFCWQNYIRHQRVASFYKYLSNSWLGGVSQWFPLYFPVILDCLTRVVWTVRTPPKQPVEWKKKGKKKKEKEKKRSAHKAVKSTLAKHHSSNFLLLLLLLLCDYPLRRPNLSPPPPPPPPHPTSHPMLGCTFLSWRLSLRLLHTPWWFFLWGNTFFFFLLLLFFLGGGVILACFFQNDSKIWNFWKVATNLCDSVNPLYEFPLVFHATNTIKQCVVRSPPMYYVTVQLIWPAMLHQRLLT